MTDPINLKKIPGLLIYKVGAREFFIDIKSVHVILGYSDNESKISRVDGSEVIYGKINFSDVEFNLIDTVKFFNAYSSRKRDSKIILCWVFGKRIGITVDKVIEFISLDDLFIEKDFNFSIYQHDRYVSWYLEFQGRKLLYPNYEKIALELSTSGFFLKNPDDYQLRLIA